MLRPRLSNGQIGQTVTAEQWTQVLELDTTTVANYFLSRLHISFPILFHTYKHFGLFIAEESEFLLLGSGNAYGRATKVWVDSFCQL